MAYNPVIAKLRSADGRRLMLLLALSCLLLVTIVIGLGQLGILTILAVLIAAVVMGAQFYSISELRSIGKETVRLVGIGWMVFCTAMLLLGTAASTLGWWQVIGGPVAAIAAGQQTTQSQLTPQVEAVRGAAEEAVAAVDELSRTADQLVDAESASGSVCGSAASGLGPSAALIRQASDRYGAVAQSTRRLAAAIRTAAAIGSSADGPPQGQIAAITEASEKLQRDAQALNDESIRFRAGTPFIDPIGNTTTSCNNPQLAGSLSTAAANLTVLEQQSTLLVQSLSQPVQARAGQTGQPSFGARFSVFEVLAVLIAVIGELGIFLLAFSVPAPARVTEAPVLLDQLIGPDDATPAQLPQEPGTANDQPGAGTKPNGD